MLVPEQAMDGFRWSRSSLRPCPSSSHVRAPMASPWAPATRLAGARGAPRRGPSRSERPEPAARAGAPADHARHAAGACCMRTRPFLSYARANRHAVVELKKVLSLYGTGGWRDLDDLALAELATPGFERAIEQETGGFGTGPPALCGRPTSTRLSSRPPSPGRGASRATRWSRSSPRSSRARREAR